MFFVSCVSHAFLSVPCCLVVTCWERTDLLALVGDVHSIFVTFPCGILGQVLYLIVSFPDLCLLSYFQMFLPWNFTKKLLENDHETFKTGYLQGRVLCLFLTVCRLDCSV